MKKQHGFSMLFVLLVVIVLAIVGFAAFRVNSNKSSKNIDSNTSDSAENATSTQENVASTVANEDVDSTTDCSSEPTLPLPVDLTRIKSILYPGQVRGGNFKPHGGFILSGTNNADITLPIDAKVIDGVRYIESGEVQYLFDFEADCGYRFRLDHLHTLTEEMQTLADTLPEPTAESRTTNVESKQIKAGTVIATRVGFLKTSNTSFDFGFYDMNTQNEASKATDWPTDFQYTTELATHGTCWLDYLSTENVTSVKALPAGDGFQGKNSVYCK